MPPASNPSNKLMSQQKIAELERAYALQKKAREEADQALEERSRELYFKNKFLHEALNKLGQQQAQLVTQEKLASVGQLGASLAHELNNPNAFIQNNLQTLEDYILRLTSGLDEALSIIAKLTHQMPTADQLNQEKHKIELIRQGSELDYIREDVPSLMRETLQGTKRITSIANSLRYFANPDVSTRKSLDVNECVQHAQKLINNKDQLAEINNTLEDIPTTLGLPMLLSQALANIIQNAIDAQKGNSKVSIRTHHQGQHIFIDIADNGPGIEKQHFPELFKPFYSTKPGKNGLGLGIAKHIIDQHKGQIHLESSPGRGTCVQITLPITTFAEQVDNDLSHTDPSPSKVVNN